MRRGSCTRPRHAQGQIRAVCGDIVASVVAVCLGVGTGVLFATLAGANAYDTFRAMWFGSVGHVSSLAGTINNAIPLVFTGLAATFAFRAGMFNIGGEGQLYVGALGAVIVGLSLRMPSLIEVPMVLLAGAAFGALLAAFAGYLRAATGAHEVITTIMLNFAAQHVVNYLVTTGPLSSGAGSAQTPPITPAAHLPVIWADPVSPVTLSFFVAIGGAVLLHWVLTRTIVGFELRAVGLNPDGARYAGIRPERYMVLSMAVAGAMAGLGGAVMVSGVFHKLVANFSPGYGFTGIAVALLARNHPLGVIPAALLFGGLINSNLELQLTAGVPRHVVYIIQATVVLFVALDPAIRARLRRGLEALR